MITGYDVATTKKVIAFLRNQNLNDYAIAGLLGNLYSESKLYSNNLQNSFNTKLMMTDQQYTIAVDNGTYSNFCSDKAGYGLAQWTSVGRKTGLYNLVKSKQLSIGNAEAQIEWLWQELNSSYRNKVLIPLQNATSVAEAAEIVVCKYEVPASVIAGGEAKQNTIKKRAGYAQDFYDEYLAGRAPVPAPTPTPSTGGYTNSPLATYTLISPNRNSPRNHVIDTITIHCFCSQVTAKRGAEVFQPKTKNASCNYVVGKDGDISLVVEEKDRSWCTSSAENDNRAVTIEVASDNAAPNAVTDKALAATIQLVADICKRNNIKQLIWSTDKKTRMKHLNGANMTVHRDYAKKSCPGEYLYSRHGYIADEVNKILGGVTPSPSPAPTPTPTPEPPVAEPAQYKDSSLAGTYKSTDALNIRTGAGTDKTKMTCIPKDYPVKNYGYYSLDGNGTKWLYVKFTYKNVTYVGYGCSTYLKKV